MPLLLILLMCSLNPLLPTYFFFFLLLLNIYSTLYTYTFHTLNTEKKPTHTKECSLYMSPKNDWSMSQSTRVSIYNSFRSINSDSNMHTYTHIFFFFIHSPHPICCHKPKMVKVDMGMGDMYYKLYDYI